MALNEFVVEFLMSLMFYKRWRYVGAWRDVWVIWSRKRSEDFRSILSDLLELSWLDLDGAGIFDFQFLWLWWRLEKIKRFCFNPFYF